MNAGAPDMQIMTSAHATVFAAARRPSLARLLALGEPEEIGANLVGMLASAHPRTAGGIALPRTLWHMLYAMVAARVELRDRLGRPLTWVSLRADLEFERYIALALDANLSAVAIATLDQHLTWLGVEPRHLEWLLTAPATGGALEAPVARELERLRQRHDHCVSVLLGGGELPRWAATDRRRPPARRATEWLAAARAGWRPAHRWTATVAVGFCGLTTAAWFAFAPVADHGVAVLLVSGGVLAVAWTAARSARRRGRSTQVDAPPAEGGPLAVADYLTAGDHQADGVPQGGGEPPKGADDGGGSPIAVSAAPADGVLGDGARGG